MSEGGTSSLSFTSKLLSSAKEAIHYEEWSDEQLRSTLEEAMRTNRTLTLENEVFERFLRRKDPQSLHKLSAVEISARQAQKIMRLRASRQVSTRLDSTPSVAGSVGSSQSKASGRRGISTTGVSKQGAKGPKITAAHRLELAEKELEDIKKLYNQFEEKIMRKKLNLETQFEELNYRIAECKEANELFVQEVVVKDPPEVKQSSPMEKFKKFMENETRLVHVKIDQWNLKTVTAKHLIRQAKRTIEQQQDMGIILRPIDFEQLMIENEYIIDEAELNNRIITALKLIGGHYNRTVKSHKNKLCERKSTLQSIEKDLVSKSHEIIDSQRTQIRATREIKKALDHLNYIKKLQENYKIPGVMDFLNSQRQLQEAKKTFKRVARQRKLQLFRLRAMKKANLKT